MERFALVLILSASACGDNTRHAGDGGDGPGDEATAFAVGTDFATTGVASTIGVPSLTVTQGALAQAASPDPVARLGDGRVFVINRYGQDNVTAFDADGLSFVAQISTGAGSNPQDVAPDGDVLFVPTFAGAGMVVLDLSDPDAGVVDTIDLSDLDPDDSIPNCHSAVRVDRQVVVVCGILDDDGALTPRGRGKVAIVDADRREVTATLELDEEHPFGFAQVTPDGTVLVPSAPDFFGDLSAGGCVEEVRLDGDDGPASAGCLIDNAEMGGFASGLGYDSAGERLWLSVTTSFDPDDYGPRGYAAAWDPIEGQLGGPTTPVDARPMDVAVCPTGHVALSEFGRGVRIYQPGGDPELTSGPVDIGLPPVSNGLVCF